MAQLLDMRLNAPEHTERSRAIGVLDQGFTALRRAGVQEWLLGMAASLPLAAALISLYTLQRVLGARPSLPLFAALCALAYCARYRVLSGLARQLAVSLGPVPAHRTQLSAGLETALLAGIGSCAWVTCLVALGQRSFFELVACLPLFCVRGALAPSLLARSACAPEAGMAALRQALADTRPLRHVFVRVELFVLLGLLVLFGNLYALLASLLLVAGSVLGLDVGFVSAVIAPDNELVLLLLLGLATLLLEPLRAAISAVAFQTARERAEGMELREAIAALPERAAERVRRQPTAAGLSVLVLSSLLCPHAHADDASGSRRALPARLAGAATMVDGVAREKARAILARGEFLPSPGDSERGPVQAWLHRRLRERERELSDHDLSAPPRFELRVPPLLVMSVSLLLMLGAGTWLARGLRRARSEVSAARLRASLAPTPARWLAEAARLAHEGAYAAAVRSLYAACVLALEREQPGFGSTSTNGQLLRQLAPGQLQAAFESLTQSFERCCYGRQQLSRAEYEQAQALVEQILRLAPQSPAASGLAEVRL